MKQLSFNQNLRMQCLEMSKTQSGIYNFGLAAELYNFILGEEDKEGVEEEPHIPTPEEALAAAQSIDIRDCGLRIGHRLYWEKDVKTLKDLAGLKKDDIVRMRNVGMKSYRQVVSLLEANHLTFGMWDFKPQE